MSRPVSIPTGSREDDESIVIPGRGRFDTLDDTQLGRGRLESVGDEKRSLPPMIPRTLPPALNLPPSPGDPTFLKKQGQSLINNPVLESLKVDKRKIDSPKEIEPAQRVMGFDVKQNITTNNNNNMNNNVEKKIIRKDNVIPPNPILEGRSIGPSEQLQMTPTSILGFLETTSIEDEQSADSASVASSSKIKQDEEGMMFEISEQ